jgi:D-tagatose-bisphosphate aldolase class II non-catalytic subunit
MGIERLTGIFAVNRRTGRGGIYSVCSAHPLVIDASLELARETGQPALIEATCNQVNQFGGYTGMRPADFATLVRASAQRANIPSAAVILGGDHLGPQPWRNEPADAAMRKALELVEAFVRAGFEKIHLDCSMRCADDPEVLAEATIAERAARMAVAAEAAARDIGTRPIYVIGTEVPPPGGMGSGHAIVPTDPAAVSATYETHRRAFAALGAADAFPRVAAIVVQPGVDFGNEDVVQFDPAGARALSARIGDLDHLVYEAHSTDFQLPGNYQALVEAHFAILKVGPAATFALREAIYGLELIEAELVGVERRSGVRSALEAAMLARPADWTSHYPGTAEQQAYLRHFSYSDRLRYYWPVAPVARAVENLFANLDRVRVPLPLICQYLPALHQQVASGSVPARANALVKAAVKLALMPYARATA